MLQKVAFHFRAKRSVKCKKNEIIAQIGTMEIESVTPTLLFNAPSVTIVFSKYVTYLLFLSLVIKNERKRNFFSIENHIIIIHIMNVNDYI